MEASLKVQLRQVGFPSFTWLSSSNSRKWCCNRFHSLILCLILDFLHEFLGLLEHSSELIFVLSKTQMMKMDNVMKSTFGLDDGFSLDARICDRNVLKRVPAFTENRRVVFVAVRNALVKNAIRVTFCAFVNHLCPLICASKRRFTISFRSQMK